MSVIKHRDYILEAIDQLRRRKARPDRERICSYVSRKFGIDNRSTIGDLERLVDEEIVIKVEYKGNISYRNAAKWSKLSVHKSRIEVELSDLNKLESMQSESERMSYVLRCAITELICRNPDYLDNGVPVYELEQFLTTKDSEFFARISFNVLLSREAKAGTVVKLENGNYLLGPSMGPATMCASSPSGSEDGERDLLMSNDEMDDSAYDDSPVKTPTKDLNGTAEKAESEPAPELPHEQPDPDPQPEPPEPEPDPEPDPAMNHKEQEENTGYRLGERRKRAKKKVFDPSDNNLPKAKRRAKQPPAAEKTVKSSPVSQPSAASSVHPATTANVNGPSTNKTPNGTCANRTPNGPGSHRTSNGPSSHRASNGPSAHRASNGPSAHRSSNGPTANRENNQIKVEAKSVQPGNKLNSIGSGAVAVCAICISAIVDGKAIQCKDCTQKAHFSCLIRGNRARFRPNSWQCMMCKTCQICSLTEEVGTLVVCTNCDEGYHVKCHIPKPKIPWKKWMCFRCAPPESKPATPEKTLMTVASRLEAAMSSYNDMTVSSIMKTIPKLLEPKIEEMEFEDSKVDETIPDASEWTTNDVYAFFNSKYPEYSSVFKDQDIDGRSLLLMTRSDVVNGLKLKLGPALKIFGQVKRLQLRRDSPHLFWE